MSEYGNIDDNVLDCIETHINKLDIGLYPFINEIISDYVTMGSIGDIDFFYTLSVFCMNIFNDNVDDLVKSLCDSGFHKWSTLGELNSLLGTFKLGDIQQLFERWFYQFNIETFGLPSSDETRIIPLDYAKYRNLVDFTCSFNVCASTVELPFVSSVASIFTEIPPDMCDKLYTAIVVDPWHGELVSDLHTALRLDDVKSKRNEVKGEYISYVPITWLKDYIDRSVDLDDKEKSWVTIRTALPKEIVKKYGLPIYEE